MTSKFSLFDKPINQVTAADLKALRDIPEGWYIDYKRDEIPAKAIAKAIGAFANTYGGWLFIGVGEKSKEEPVAKTFPGVHRDDVDAVVQRIRNGANSQLSPVPRFETHAIWGPNEELGLNQDQAIICVEVPESRITPHVHGDGRIYRRVSDSSEPKPETDRHLLDALWERRRDVEKDVKNWIEHTPEFSTKEAESPFMRLLIVSDPWGERDPWLQAPLHEIRAILGAEGPNHMPSVPFDAVHTNSRGFVARQLIGNDPNKLSLTWSFRRDLSGEVLIPLSYYDLKDIRMVAHHLVGYDHGERFAAVLTKYSFDRVRFVDLNLLLYLLAGIATHQRNLMKLAGAQPTFKVKIKLLNCWRTVPFLDTEYAMQAYEEHGIPVSLSSDILVPSGYDPDSFAEITDASEQQEIDVAPIWQAYLMLAWVSQAMGLPLDVPDDADAPVYPDFRELDSAAKRSMKVQRVRNQRKTT